MANDDSRIFVRVGPLVHVMAIASFDVHVVQPSRVCRPRRRGRIPRNISLDDEARAVESVRAEPSVKNEVPQHTVPNNPLKPLGWLSRLNVEYDIMHKRSLIGVRSLDRNIGVRSRPVNEIDSRDGRMSCVVERDVQDLSASRTRAAVACRGNVVRDARIVGRSASGGTCARIGRATYRSLALQGDGYGDIHACRPSAGAGWNDDRITIHGSMSRPVDDRVYVGLVAGRRGDRIRLRLRAEKETQQKDE